MNRRDHAAVRDPALALFTVTIKLNQMVDYFRQSLSYRKRLIYLNSRIMQIDTREIFYLAHAPTWLQQPGLGQDEVRISILASHGGAGAHGLGPSSAALPGQAVSWMGRGASRNSNSTLMWDVSDTSGS